MTLEQIALTAVLALLIGRFETAALAKPQASRSMAVASWLFGGLSVVGFILLWNTLLRSG